VAAPPAPKDEKAERAQRLENELLQAGWDRPAAAAVVRVNAGWFEALRQDREELLDRQVRLLCRLGKFPALGPFLGEHPEAAGLLAGVEDPEGVARSLEGDDYALLAGVYMRHVTSADALDLAQALEHDRTLIAGLVRRGFAGFEVLFLFPRDGEAAAEYDRWLQDVLSVRLHASDEELASAVHLLLSQGPKIRRRLHQDETFRKCFRRELWPKLARVAAAQRNALEPYLYDSRVWDLLALQEGEHLLKDWGRLPVLLLFDPEHAYPADLHDRVVEALLAGDELTVRALFTYRDEPLFRNLLRRSLKGPTLAAALHKLFQAGPDYPRVLAKLDQLQTQEAVDEYVGPPPEGVKTWVPCYYTYYVGWKLYNGLDPTPLEWIQAVADPALMLLPEVKAGGTVVTKGGEEVFTVTLGNAARTAAKEAGMELARKEVATAAEQLAEKGLENEAVTWGITGLLTKMQAPLTHTVDKLTTVEVTAPVQFMFRHGGVDRETFKVLTGLEARLFMRSDARVCIHLNKTLVAEKALAYLNDQAKSAIEQRVADTLDTRRDPATAAQNEERARAQLEAWQRNASAWWLLNAGGLPQPAAEPRR
jgi:hypothetical protein